MTVSGIQWKPPRVDFDPRVNVVFQDLMNRLRRFDELTFTALMTDFACIYNSGTDLTQTVAISTPEKLTQFSTNFEASNGCVPDAANHRILLVRTGVYIVLATFSGTSDINNTFLETLGYLNGGHEPTLHVERKIGTGGDYGAWSMIGPVYNKLPNQYLEVWIESDKAADIITDECTLTAIRLPWSG
jgi:hypothetical protein